MAQAPRVDGLKVAHCGAVVTLDQCHHLLALPDKAVLAHALGLVAAPSSFGQALVQQTVLQQVLQAPTRALHTAG